MKCCQAPKWLGGFHRTTHICIQPLTTLHNEETHLGYSFPSNNGTFHSPCTNGFAEWHPGGNSIKNAPLLLSIPSIRNAVQRQQAQENRSTNLQAPPRRSSVGTDTFPCWTTNLCWQVLLSTSTTDKRALKAYSNVLTHAFRSYRVLLTTFHTYNSIKTG